MNPGDYHVVLPGDSVLATGVRYHRGPLFRMRGLLGRKGLAPGEGILLMPCNAIHMFFMSFPIDAVFLDHEFRVLRVYHSIRPWKLTPIVRRARAVLEISAGRCREAELQEGMALRFVNKT